MSFFCFRIHLCLHDTDGLEGRCGSPKVIQPASGRAQAEPNLPLPVYLGLLPSSHSYFAEGQHLLLCKGLQNHRHPCPTLPAHPWPCFQDCLHYLPVHVLTRACVSTCSEMTASGFAPMDAGSPVLCDLPVWPHLSIMLGSPPPRSPHPTPHQCSALSGNGGYRANFNKELYFWFWRLLPQPPFLPQLFLSVLGPLLSLVCSVFHPIP